MANQIKSTPVTDAVSDDIKRVPVDVLNLRWVYCHYPTAWTFKDNSWVPELTQICFRNGLNSQSQDGDYSGPELHIAKKGGTIIRPNHPKLGKHKSYLVTVPAVKTDTRALGKFYCSKWESPTVIGGNVVKWKSDTKGYHEFLTHLVDSGIIEPISSAVVESKIDMVRGQIDNLMSQPSNEFRKATIAHLEAQLEGMIESLTNLDDYEETEIAVEVEEEEVVEVAPKKLPGRAKKAE
jgi:hypothetical protein